MSYLMIENAGVAPFEAYTQLGDSGTRHRADEGLIGQFGSGNKLAITMFIRMGVEVKVCGGPNTLEFFPEINMVTEADGTVRESYPMKCKISGKVNRTVDLGWTLEMGALDWRETRMGLREFIANSLDCSKIMGSEPVVKVEQNKRARAGHTRVFIQMTPDVMDYFRNLSKHFLHFSTDPGQVDQRFLRKNPESRGPMIYFEGSLIRTLDSDKQAAFDYNFRKGEIQIDECRNSSEYSLRAAIARQINSAPVAILKELFVKLTEGECYEASLDGYYLGYSVTDDEKQNWTQAWEQFAGNAVIANETLARSPIADHAQKKGHKIVVVKSNAVAKVAEDMGVKTVTSVLGTHAGAGRVECEPTRNAMESVAKVWDWVEACDLTNGKECPKVMSFKQLMDGEAETLGYYVHGSRVVHIREDLAGGLALKTAMEEVGHYITGATDMSRDFQNFFIDMIVELCD